MGHKLKDEKQRRNKKTNMECNGFFISYKANRAKMVFWQIKSVVSDGCESKP